MTQQSIKVKKNIAPIDHCMGSNFFFFWSYAEKRIRIRILNLFTPPMDPDAEPVVYIRIYNVYRIQQSIKKKQYGT